MFSRFVTMPSCDGQMDGQTTAALYRASVASRGKNWPSVSLRGKSRRFKTAISKRYLQIQRTDATAVTCTSVSRLS